MGAHGKTLFTERTVPPSPCKINGPLTLDIPRWEKDMEKTFPVDRT